MNNKQICQLCLDRAPAFECETIDEIKKTMLEFLLININFDISDCALACTMCLGRLHESFDFKSRCSITFVEADNKADVAKAFKRDMMSNYGSIGNISLRRFPVCCLCVSSSSTEWDNNYITNLNDRSMLTEMIKYCFPEMDLNDANEPSICKPCLTSLKRLHEFLKSCREMERLCQLVAPGTADIPILKELLKSKDYEALGKTIIIKKECSDTENDLNPGNMKNEDIPNIKCEKLDTNDESNTGVEMGASVPLRVCTNSKNTNSLKTKRQIRQFASKGGKHFSSDDRIGSHRRLTKVFGCQECKFMTDRKYILAQHTVRHKEMDVNSGVPPPSKTKCKRGMLNRQLSDKKSEEKLDKHEKYTKFKCEKCPYKTDSKSRLRRHNLKHNDKSEVEILKCENCEFETRYKDSMIKHMLRHRDTKAEKKFKCDKCLYETDFQCHLRKHNLRHEDKSKVEMHKCENCEFETRYKYGVTRHMLLKHRDPKVERKYKCGKCPYESDFKSSVRRHCLIHKDNSEVEIYKCENCEFETRYKGSMINHTLKHRDTEAERKFKCDKCPYETDIKAYLSVHILRHKDKSEVKTHKCKNCEYETRYKGSMINHMLKHRDPGAERKFKCDECPYETDFKASLRRHTLTHKDKSEVEMHKCEVCQHETRQKNNMIRHMLKHRDPKAEKILSR